MNVEVNSREVKDPCEGGVLMVTPPVGDKSYWLARVNLFEDQSVIAFPKFGTIGIGFSIEEDWNTNLPYRKEAEEIREHIWHNRRYSSIKKKKTDKAIRLLQEWIKKWRGRNEMMTSEKIALGNYMHEYAEELTFEENLEKIENGELTVAEAYEDLSRKFLAREIEGLAEMIQRAIVKEAFKR